MVLPSVRLIKFLLRFYQVGLVWHCNKLTSGLSNGVTFRWVGGEKGGLYCVLFPTDYCVMHTARVDVVINIGVASVASSLPVLLRFDFRIRDRD